MFKTLTWGCHEVTVTITVMSPVSARTSMMVSSLGARFFSTSSLSRLSIMGFKMAWSFLTWTRRQRNGYDFTSVLQRWNTYRGVSVNKSSLLFIIKVCCKSQQTTNWIQVTQPQTINAIPTVTQLLNALAVCIYFRPIGEPSVLSWLTCSSVFTSPNSSRKVVSEENCAGSRKLSRLNSSSTEFCSGVPVSSTLCSYWSLSTTYTTITALNKTG